MSEEIIVITEESMEVIAEAQQGPQGPAGPSALAAQIIGEVPAGLVNGSNATFTTAFAFVPETVDVTLNGLRLKKVDEFTTTGGQTILLTFSPGAGEQILVNYLRA